MGELDSHVPYFCQVAYARAKSIMKEDSIEAKSLGSSPAGIFCQKKGEINKAPTSAIIAERKGKF
jgi:hypothetical protein